ncbi:3-methyl-2-oxobutanoatehydroxymethyltransferase [Schizosaccharomyces cryophilus OY26]|uniref:3-methyl-2-oxobutanoate hydroxymethyltransferase n=1 Tax=Schizosaccharomyces cryophilus (strain OY26 / ATCC MYA-4695 / CBS 11777 / NBRC 106824 / NRRL Y48691) TaxID=653667 RepID=S9W2M7_SCHCR|nr:3-methyl-2-oxobutanoatehydroxymethyltransferase [Schizosaccharomyces cryophilus OY26]EPY52704.1 3-methyl-2-oxobutanoatehydroxymethyltransferase [Schizosaccharomyces cryophilus OY26]
MLTKPITTSVLRQWKLAKEKFSCITAYDASFSRLFEEQGMPVMLVGDSLGMAAQGHTSTLPVSVSDVAYHTRSVRRGAPNCLLMADMPFMSYSNADDACKNAASLMRSGANVVKLEGSGSWIYDTIRKLAERSVPVCGHIGMTPQAVNIYGGFKIQGRNETAANQILESAKQIEKAGAQILVLECIPETLGQQITESVSIPTIGIGAGKHTDSQILVMHDALGISSGKAPRFVKNFLSGTGDIRAAVRLYIQEVKEGLYPAKEHTY